ncbi:MAG: carboxypeptidase regulatory-like domain-containing protein, partial [Chloroflexaceae bacterium]|nr:carboxypeptidase regulatory-like domain-containing protein [Chloroflexaceae bacterium]
ISRLPQVSPQGADVALLLQQNTVVRDVVDEFGYFALDNVTAGHYTMRIDLAPDSILIEGIALV